MAKKKPNFKMRVIKEPKKRPKVKVNLRAYAPHNDRRANAGPITYKEAMTAGDYTHPTVIKAHKEAERRREREYKKRQRSNRNEFLNPKKSKR